MADALRFLVVDDCSDDRALVARALRETWPTASVVEAADLASAERAMRASGADVVISDYWLSGTTGLDVLAMVHAIAADCPVIMVTGTGNEEVAAEALKAGFTDYILKKPTGLARLPSSVGAALAIRDGRRARAAAEAALESSRRFAEHVIDASSEVVYVLDLVAGRVAFVNRRLESVLGYTAAELRAMAPAELADLVHPDDRDRLRREWDRDAHMPDTEVAEYDFRVRHASGDWRCLNSRYVVLARSADGAARQVLGAARDVTAERVAREQHEESRLFLDALVNQAPDMVYVFDVDTRSVTFVNRRIESMLGYTPDEIVAMGDTMMARLMPPDEAERIERLIARMVTVDAPPAIEAEFRACDKGGNERWLRGRVCVFKRGADGRVRQLMASALDITEEHLAAERARLLTTALRATAEAIVITNRAGTIQWVNPAFTTLTGYTAAEAIGETPRLLKSGEQDPAYYRDLWETVLGGRVWRGRLINRRKDGTTFIEDMSVTPVLADAPGGQADSEPAHFVAIKHDVTAEVEREEQLRAKDEQLLHAQRIESIGQLAGGIAHDFNNLLTAILGYVDLALADTPESDSRYEDLVEIRNGGERAADLTRQLLAFSRRQVLRPAVVTAGDVIAGVEKMLRRLIRENIRLEIDTTAEIPPVRVDVGQIEQVLVNLVVNGADAMPDGGRLRISTATRTVDEAFVSGHPGARPGRFVEIAVSDSGVGMDPGVAARIFEPYFTTKPAGKGTGLGLSVAYGIVKQSEGYIWVDSVPGAGTTFIILLPEANADSAVRRQEVAALAPPAGRLARILVVDDDERVGQLVEKVLRRHGHDVRYARSSEEADQCCEQWQDRVDLMVVDVVMPDENGYDLATRLVRRCPSSRVVMISGYDEVLAGRSDAGRRTASFLPKPFDPVTLAKLVADVLAPSAEVKR